jgi:hypothetical protein
MLALYQHPDNKKTPPKLVSSYQQLYEPTKVDQSSRWTLEWPALGIISDLKTDMNTAGHADSTCLIQCEKADISIQSKILLIYTVNKLMIDPPYRPESFTVIPHSDDSEIKRETFKYPPAAGGGWHYQADHVGRLIRDGKIESDRMPWEESRITQGWLDQVRKDGSSVLKDLKGQV